MTLTSNDVSNINEIFASEIRYCVPKFQRGFSWETENFEKLWDDIIELMNSKVQEKEYFFGMLVLLKESSKKEIQIIDGQQRITTITILLSVIRNLINIYDLHVIGEKSGEWAGEIGGKYISRKDRRSGHDDRRLSLNKHDDSFFKTFVQQGRIMSKDLITSYREEMERAARTRSEKNLFNAFWFFTKKITEILEEMEVKERIEFIEELRDTITRNLKVMKLVVEDPEDAYKIFETLNDRALELTVVDLLKNHLFSKAGNREDEIERAWDKMLENLGNNVKPTMFLRHFYISKIGDSTEDQLYGNFKKMIIDKQMDILNFVEMMKNEAEIYDQIMNPNLDDWEKETFDQLEIFRQFNVKQALILLLGARASIKDEKIFRQLLELCTIFTFRYSIISGKNPNKLDKIYGDISRKIRLEAEINFSYIKKVFKEESPDNDFSNDFLVKELTNTKVAKYILRSINMEIKSTAFSEWQPLDKLTLEHILPKVPNNEWYEFVPKNRTGPLANRIGNMTLLEKRPNSTIRNQIFKIKKKDAYSKSNMPTTKYVNDNFDKWDENSINKLQKYYADQAQNIWKI